MTNPGLKTAQKTLISRWGVSMAPKYAKLSAYTYYTKLLKKVREFYIKKAAEFTAMMAYQSSEEEP